MIINRTEREKLTFDLELAQRQIESDKADPNARPKNIDILTKHIQRIRAEIDALPIS
jgi:hypothetical protein